MFSTACRLTNAGADHVIRKTLLILTLVALAAITAEALSQTSGGNSTAKAAAPSATSPSAPSTKSSAVDGPAVTKNSSSSGSNAAANPASKESGASKKYQTSSGYGTTTPATGSTRKELVIERASVTLIDDNMVPATEAGMLLGQLAKEGQIVAKEDLVAEIDSRSTKAKQRIAEAEKLAAEASAENDAEVEVAEKAVEVSLAEYEQSKDIRAKNPGAVSETQLRKDKFNYQKSLAQVKQAKNEKHIAGLTANAKKAQYDAASIELDLRQIRSPFKGQVVEVMKHVGDWVTVGEPIMHIVGLDRLRVKGYVLVSGSEGASESASHDEVYGKPVTITVDAPGGKKHTVKGTIGFASPVIEGLGSDRQFRIWAEVDNEKLIDPVTKQETWKIQPGSMATMTIDLNPPKPSPVAKTEPAKGGKGKVESLKPVADDKSGTKKASSKER